MPEPVYEKVIPQIVQEWDKFNLPKVDKSKLKVKALPFRKSGLHSMLCFMFSDGDKPIVVVKLPRNSDGKLAFEALEHEYNVLTKVKAILQGSIPDIYSFQKINNIPVLFFKAYAGAMFNLLLDREEDLASLDKLLSKGSDIILQLGERSKSGEKVIDADFVQKWIKQPFELIKKVFPKIDPKLDLSMMGEKYPVIITHQEFNPWNIITDEKGGPVVFDWEDGIIEGLPFVDLYNYFMIAYRILMIGETDKTRQRKAEDKKGRVAALLKNYDQFMVKYCKAIGVAEKTKDFFFFVFALNIIAFFLAEKRNEAGYAKSWLPLLISAPHKDSFKGYVQLESGAFLKL